LIYTIRYLTLLMLSNQSVKSWYRGWFNSPYYHLLYEKRDEQEAASFIENLIKRLNPALTASMLDIGCGKGRHSKMLAAKGFLVTGLDISEESIREARHSENDHLEFFVHDMRLPFRINYYDYVFNFFTSFGYFNTEREHNNAIKTFAQALKKGGTLVIDYLNVHYTDSHLVKESEVTKNDVSFLIKRWSDDHHFYKNIIVNDPQNLPNPLSYTEKVAKFKIGDFTEMLSYHGLQIQEVFGSYDFQPYDLHTSPRLILFAKKL